MFLIQTSGPITGISTILS